MRKLYVLALALMVLLSMTLSVEALEQKTINRQSGMTAYADWTETTAEGQTTDTYLSVTESNDGTDIYISICTYDTTGYYACESGYKFTTEDVFSMDKKLVSASLSGVDIEVYDWNTGAAETLKNVRAEWTGTGDVSTGSFKYTSKYGDYMMKSSSSSSYREAGATGSIDDIDLGVSAYGGMGKFKSADIYMEK